MASDRDTRSPPHLSIAATVSAGTRNAISGSLAVAGRPRFGLGTIFVAFIVMFEFVHPRALIAYINDVDLRSAYPSYSSPFEVGEGARRDAGACFRSWRRQSDEQQIYRAMASADAVPSRNAGRSWRFCGCDRLLAEFDDREAVAFTNAAIRWGAMIESGSWQTVLGV